MDRGADGRVDLRPVVEADLAALQELTGRRENLEPFAFYGFLNPGRWQREWDRGDLQRPTAQRGTFTVTLDDDFAGYTEWGETRWFGTVCPSIGITLLPAVRGQGCGSEAQRQLAAHLFATTPINRVEAHTEIDNLAEIHALENAGFQREGVLRGTCWRMGRWRDGVLYAITRDHALN